MSCEYFDNVSGSLSVGFGPPQDIAYNALSTGGTTTRIADPYQVWAMKGCFYLIGRCHIREAVRTFDIDRIKELAVIDRSLIYPEDFFFGGTPTNSVPSDDRPF